MKFTTTENTSYKYGVGYVPKNWIETAETDHETVIKKYFYDNIRVWDFDVCGDEIHDFLFDDGRAFRLEYSWWRTLELENEDDDWHRHEYTITEISAEEANVPNRVSHRDWI